MASQTLVEAGVDVAMLDVGVTDKKYVGAIPNKDFLSLRNHDNNQYRYLIGERFEGLLWGDVDKGEQITPPRKYIFNKTEDLVPIEPSSFTAVESLAYGGLGVGWGIGCWTWSTQELLCASLDPKKMHSAYQAVLDRIGISATADGAAAYTIGTLKNYDKSATLDNAHSRLYKKYKGREDRLKKHGLTMGRTPLALITKDRGDRKKYSYEEMEYYTDRDESAYRPWITVNRLREKHNFTYIGNRLVTSFREITDGVEVTALNTETKEKVVYTTRKLILAAGVFGTSRIVLRSSGANSSVHLPILCNAYTYIPCIQPALLGKSAEKRKLGFANLSFFLDEKGDNSDASMASLYGYQSLMLYRLARQVPLNFNDGRKLLQYLTSGLTIMGIHHPDSPSDNKYLSLVPSESSPTNDALKINYSLSREETKDHRRRESKYMAAMRSMGAFPLKRFKPGHGAGLHYAGALPFSTENKPFTLSPCGKLAGTNNVHVADGSGFTHLAAKGLTFTLMANAHNTALEALNE